MAGCCVVVLAPLMLALAAVIVIVGVGLLVAGIASMAIGILGKSFSKEPKFQFVFNICLAIGAICILALLSVELPIVSGVISLVIGLMLIKRSDEWKLLLYYIPAMAVILLLGAPQLQLIELSVVLAILVFIAIVIGLLVGIVWLALQGRKNEKPVLMKEGYSLIFFSEATLSFLMFAITMCANTP